MVERHKVVCIKKSNSTNAHERITHIGIKNSDDETWKITEGEAIDRIENKGWTFYVTQSGLTVDVIVASRSGKKYLKTKNDGEQPDNLLALPECS